MGLLISEVFALKIDSTLTWKVLKSTVQYLITHFFAKMPLRDIFALKGLNTK